MIRNRIASASGFILGLGLFLIANYYDYEKMARGGCADCFLTFGVPFTMYGSGGFVTVSHYFWSGITADLFVAFVFSVGLGCIFNRLAKRLMHTGRDN
jgi:hypothetical protein